MRHLAERFGVHVSEGPERRSVPQPYRCSHCRAAPGTRRSTWRLLCTSVGLLKPSRSSTDSRHERCAFARPTGQACKRPPVNRAKVLPAQYRRPGSSRDGRWQDPLVGDCNLRQRSRRRTLLVDSDAGPAVEACKKRPRRSQGRKCGEGQSWIAGFADGVRPITHIPILEAIALPDRSGGRQSRRRCKADTARLPGIDAPASFKPPNRCRGAGVALVRRNNL